MTTVVTQPTLIPRPWASAPDATYDVIPDTTTQFGRASWSKGFPSDTALPLNAGGIPPNWLDFQGVLNALSQHACFEQAGGHYAWSNAINYPAGACIIGSNGTLYKALQESGPGTTAGAKNPTSSGNSTYWGALATPDGNTIKVNNGKLAVDLSNIADGTTIVVSNNKLTAVSGGGDASSLVDNITTVANNDKISVDLSSATAAALNNISPYLAQTDGGLLTDFTTGKLEVDFSRLHLMHWIGESGIGTEFYVDGTNGSDSTGDGSLLKPWATISRATQQICANYNINSRAVHINVKAGTYTNPVALPLQQRTTGYIVIRPASDSDAVNVAISATGSQHAFTHSGGLWYLDDLNITLTLAAQTSENATYPSIIYSSDSTGEVHVRHCNLSFVDNTVAPVSGTYGAVTANLVWAAGGTIHLENKAATGKLESAWSGTAGEATVVWMLAENNGFMIIQGGTSQAFNVSGKYDTFCSVGMGSYYRTRNGTPTWTGISSPQGKRYNVYNGGGILTGSGSPSTYFPGNTAGTVDSSTYSWYK